MSPNEELLNCTDKHEIISIEDLVELDDDALGLKVVIESPGQSTVGVVSYIMSDCHKLALQQASDPRSGGLHPGLAWYFFFEITSITIIGRDKDATKALLKLIREEDEGGKRMRVKKIVRIQNDNDDHIDEDLALLNVGADDLVEEEIPLRDHIQAPPDAPPIDPPPRGVNRASQKIIIDKFDQNFSEAICHIKRENIVSLSVKGKEIGRYGTLAWINIATSDICYFFDAGQMNTRLLLKNGLSDIIQSKSILKIVYDSRFLNDLLHHVYNVDLNNIFDIQAAVIYEHMVRHHETVPSFLAGLPNLLVKFLNFSPAQIFFIHIREESSQEDQLIWFERPLSDELVEEMFQCVVYLEELRDALLKLILVDLNQVTNIFSTSFTNLSSALYHTIDPQIVPKAVQDLATKSVINCKDLQNLNMTLSNPSLKKLSNGL